MNQFKHHRLHAQKWTAGETANNKGGRSLPPSTNRVLNDVFIDKAADRIGASGLV